LDLQITLCYSLLRLIWDLQISVTTDLQINLIASICKSDFQILLC
jgi:hypothetical protein